MAESLIFYESFSDFFLILDLIVASALVNKARPRITYNSGKNLLEAQCCITAGDLRNLRKLQTYVARL